MGQHHTIEIFSANCPLCKDIVEDIEIGRCKGCKQIVYDVNDMTGDIKTKKKKYCSKAVPTPIIDGIFILLVSLIFLGYVEKIYFKISNTIIHSIGTEK